MPKLSDLADKEGFANVVLSNCTTTIPLILDFDGKNTGHTVVIGPTGKGMSALLDCLEREQVKAGADVRVMDIGPTLKG